MPVIRSCNERAISLVFSKAFAIIIHAAIFACSPTVCMTQEAAYEVGEYFPMIRVKQILSNNDQSENQQFDKKYIILDFWSTTCASCVKKMPQLKNFQEKYSTSLKIVLVTSDSRKHVDSFLNKNPFFERA